MKTKFFLTALLTLTMATFATNCWGFDLFFPTGNQPLLSDFDKLVVIGRPASEIECQDCATGIQNTTAIVLKHGAEPTVLEILYVQELKPGTRFSSLSIVFQGICVADFVTYDLYYADSVGPKDAGVAAFEVDPVEQSLEGYTGVVTGKVAENGLVQVVFTKKGAPAIKIYTQMYDYTEMGDRFTEVTMVYADELGTVYEADVDY